MKTDIVDAEFSVFGYIVEQTGCQRLGVHVQLSQNLGHGDGMGDIGFATLPAGETVSVAGQQIGAEDQLLALRLEAVGQVAPEQFEGLFFFGKGFDFDAVCAVGCGERLDFGQHRPQRGRGGNLTVEQTPGRGLDI